MVSICATTGCERAIHSETHTPAEVTALDAHSPYLKAFMRAGSKFELTQWKVDLAANRVTGTGRRLDAEGAFADGGSMAIPIDSVVVFETNRPSGMPPALMGITIVVAAVAAVGLAKVLFGSCPTFYVDDGRPQTLQAEGFSSSIAPPLEATDVDALYRVRPQGRDLEIVMKNEALETHVVRFVNVLAAPRPAGGRVFATSTGTFRQATRMVSPDLAIGPEGDCLEVLRAFDGRERFSTADSSDLAAHERLELEFRQAPEGDLALVIASRQTLMSTFLFYRSLASLGGDAGSLLAEYERSSGARRERLDDRVSGFSRALGGVDVDVLDATGRWIRAGRSKETEPLATDVRAVPLPGSAAHPPARPDGEPSPGAPAARARVQTRGDRAGAGVLG